MNIIGLDPNCAPYKYLDEYIPTPDWDKMHIEASLGIAKSVWSKKFVSSGVHRNWAEQEITTTFLDLENRLTPDQLAAFHTLKETDQKIKYLNALTYTPHPFWLIFLRWNRRTEGTGVQNKSVAEDCFWTDNARHFPKLVEFIKSMPFESIGRVLFFMTEANATTVPHFDAANEEQRITKGHDDFIWFNTKSKSKGIYVMDKDTLEKVYPDPDKRFIWWNEMDFHGTDPVGHFSFSIRIDGKFKPEVKQALITG